MDGFTLTYDGCEPAEEGLREALTSTGNGHFCTRGAAEWEGDSDGMIEPVRKRQFPIVGGGGGVSSFIHLDDAAAATVRRRLRADRPPPRRPRRGRRGAADRA